MRARQPLHVLAVAAAAVLLGACAVPPRPLAADERQAAMQQARERMFAQQEALAGPVTLEEAMARAIKYNLDHRVKLMEEAVARRQLDLSRIDLLPRLAAQAGYSSRDKVLASSSQDIVTGAPSLANPSTSSEKQHTTTNLSVSWNVLDFGVSYYTAHQHADRLLAAQERRRKVLHLLMQQTRQAWWQAAGAQQLHDKVGPVLEQARAALDDARKVEAERVRAPLEALSYQRQLLDIVRQLEAVRDELAQARPRLAAVMNLPPGQAFTVDAVAPQEAPPIALRAEQLEETALLNRPELVEAQYNERIGVLETRKAMSRLLPGLELSFGAHRDSNSFLVHNDWTEAGLRLSWNLLNVFNAEAIKGAAQAQLELARQQRLALGMAVLAQVHVAYLDYQARSRQYALMQEYHTVEQRILQHTSNAAAANAQGKLESIRAAASAMMAELRLHQAYGALQGAYGQVIATLGLDPLPDSVPGHDLQRLGQAVKDTERSWTRAVNPG